MTEGDVNLRKEVKEFVSVCSSSSYCYVTSGWASSSRKGRKKKNFEESVETPKKRQIH